RLARLDGDHERGTSLDARLAQLESRRGVRDEPRLGQSLAHRRHRRRIEEGSAHRRRQLDGRHPPLRERAREAAVAPRASRLESGCEDARHISKEIIMAAKPIPDGFHTVTPYFVVNGAAKLIDWAKKGLDATELERMTTPDGLIQHAQIK